MDFISQEEYFHASCRSYLARNESKNEYDFIIEEIQKIENAENEYKKLCSLDKQTLFEKLRNEDYLSVNRSNTFTDYDIEKYCESFLRRKHVKIRGVSRIRKDYLQYKLRLYESVYSIKEDNNSLKHSLNIIQSDVEELANSENILSLNNAEKIVLLNELGVIDFLKAKQPFNASGNILAKILSMLMNEKQSTVSAALRGLSDKDPKRDPYKNEKNKEKILNILLKEGFKLK